MSNFLYIIKENFLSIIFINFNKNFFLNLFFLFFNLKFIFIFFKLNNYVNKILNLNYYDINNFFKYFLFISSFCLFLIYNYYFTC